MFNLKHGYFKMSKSNFAKFLTLFFFLVTTSGKDISCTHSGHKCTSVVPGVSNPCVDPRNEQISIWNLLVGVCDENWNSDLFLREICDYCPEEHDILTNGTLPTYRPNITACRQEDGYYKCQLGGFTDNCIRRTWVSRSNICGKKDETIIVNLNCTDNELTCRLVPHCILRNEINTIMTCNPKPRDFIIKCHSEDEFECRSSGRCIPRDWVRDGSIDCTTSWDNIDTSDEDKALEECNSQTEFRCQDEKARCISREMVMDGRQNCPDSSDESKALKMCKKELEFRCESNGRCIRRYRVNDGFPDCPHGTDEAAEFMCLEQLEFDCGDGRCIPRSWVGNSLVDCVDGSDERGGILMKCQDNEFSCHDGSRCLPKMYMCDGIKNCADCSDEVEFCEEALRFRCNDDPSVCVPWTLTCDGVPDCKDMSDEQTHLLQGFKCSINSKTCYVPQFMLNKTVDMCGEMDNLCYDEEGKFLCARCLDGKAISKLQICDGVIDCGDLSDECPCQDVGEVRLVCDRTFLYHNSTSRESADTVCNGVDDWKDKLDEMFCPSLGPPNTEFAANETVFQPKNYKCKELSNKTLLLFRAYDLTYLEKKHLFADARKCDGHIECLFFDDECSDECPNQPKFCKTIPLREMLVIGELLGIPDWKEEARVCFSNHIDFTDVFSPVWICDGLQHCEGGQDETNCPDRFYCDARSGSTFLKGTQPIISVAKKQICDLFVDCRNSEDEYNCSSSTHFYCLGKKPLFIDRKKYLDGHPDCNDYSDECPIEQFDKNPFSSPTELLNSIVLKVFIWLVAATSLIGNLWVIVTTIKELRAIKDKNSIGYCNRMLVTNLALADFLTGICLSILMVKSLEFSGEYCLHDVDWKMSTTCDAIGVLLVISSETSLNVIVMLTGLRLYSVLRKAQTKMVNHKYCCCITAIAWSTSIFTAFYPVWQKKSFSSSVKITKNLFFNNTLVDRTVLEKYYNLTDVVNSIGNNNNSVFTSSDYLTSEAAKSYFPQRYIHVEGANGYYSSNSVCFPNYFNLSTTESYFSLIVILYNTAAVLFVMVSYIIFYRKATAKTIVTSSSSHTQRNEKLKHRITVLVLTSMGCWLPICVLAFYASFANTKDSLPEVTYVIAAVVILPIDSCFNPLLYSEVHVKIYNAVRDGLRKLCE